jgi:hypothetical protein
MNERIPISDRPGLRGGIAVVAGAGALLYVSLVEMNPMANNSQPIVAAGETVPEPLKPQPKIPLPRDPEIAVREEYDSAMKAGTIAALELFIARHPGHPLAAEAEDGIARLKTGTAPE